MQMNLMLESGHMVATSDSISHVESESRQLANPSFSGELKKFLSETKGAFAPEEHFHSS